MTGSSPSSAEATETPGLPLRRFRAANCSRGSMSAIAGASIGRNNVRSELGAADSRVLSCARLGSGSLADWTTRSAAISASRATPGSRSRMAEWADATPSDVGKMPESEAGSQEPPRSESSLGSGSEPDAGSAVSGGPRRALRSLASSPSNTARKVGAMGIVNEYCGAGGTVLSPGSLFFLAMPTSAMGRGVDTQPLSHQTAARLLPPPQAVILRMQERAWSNYIGLTRPDRIFLLEAMAAPLRRAIRFASKPGSN